jgi:RHS repeat-associated protein
MVGTQQQAAIVLAVEVQFTGKERDVETGLDYFGARYFSGAQGRFTSLDSGPWLLLNPQSYNRYTYGLNNPLRYGDEDGETPQDRVNAANRLASQNIPYAHSADPSVGGTRGNPGNPGQGNPGEPGGNPGGTRGNPGQGNPGQYTQIRWGTRDSTLKYD